MFKAGLKRKYLLQVSGIITLTVLIMSFFFSKTLGIAAAVDVSGTRFGISTSPSSGFLKAPNMAPGDWVNSPLTVKNDGELEFSYDVRIQRDSGSIDYFNLLDLKIQDKKGNILYNGKLKDLNGLVMGILGKGGSDTFNFSVGLPLEADNSYQGLGTEVTFLLTAKEHPPSIEGGEILWDPPLEKPDVHVRRGTVMPVRFHIINNGTFDTVKRGVDLIVTGVNDAGQPVEYAFSITDATLEWEEHGLKKPHYSLHFNTRDYPVKFGTYYTAKVMYGNQVLGSTQFKSGR
ncbi:MAG: hypothetical protein M0Z31_04855 [Clostridia bacterium]|nr:hypothetical protein [Clostridia bacterium]